MAMKAFLHPISCGTMRSGSAGNPQVLLIPFPQEEMHWRAEGIKIIDFDADNYELTAEIDTTGFASYYKGSNKGIAQEARIKLGRETGFRVLNGAFGMPFMPEEAISSYPGSLFMWGLYSDLGPTEDTHYFLAGLLFEPPEPAKLTYRAFIKVYDVPMVPPSPENKTPYIDGYEDELGQYREFSIDAAGLILGEKDFLAHPAFPNYPIFPKFNDFIDLRPLHSKIYKKPIADELKSNPAYSFALHRPFDFPVNRGTPDASLLEKFGIDPEDVFGYGEMSNAIYFSPSPQLLAEFAPSGMGFQYAYTLTIIGLGRFEDGEWVEYNPDPDPPEEPGGGGLRPVYNGWSWKALKYLRFWKSGPRKEKPKRDIDGNGYAVGWE